MDLMTAWQLDLCAVGKELWVRNKLGFYFLLRSSSFFFKEKRVKSESVSTSWSSQLTHTETDKSHTFP